MRARAHKVEMRTRLASKAMTEVMDFGGISLCRRKL